MNKRKSAVASSGTARQSADSAKEWAASPEGRHAIERGLEEARTMAEQFRKAQCIDPEILHKPVTL